MESRAAMKLTHMTIECEEAALKFVSSFFHGVGRTDAFPSDEFETTLDQVFDLLWAFKERKHAQLRARVEEAIKDETDGEEETGH